MDNEIPPNKPGNKIQRTLLGIAVAFAAVLTYLSKSEQMIKFLGASYPMVTMACAMIVIFAAGFSGWEFIYYAKDLMDMLPKRKKDD